MRNKYILIFLILFFLIVFLAIFNSKKQIFKKPTLDIVVSKYKEDTKSLKDINNSLFDFDIKIYTKEDKNSKYNVPKNKGHEASVYLKYIIDHYNNLPDYVVFIHAHETDWHYPISMKKTLNNLTNYIVEKNNGYYNFSEIFDEFNCAPFKLDLKNEKDDMVKWWKENMLHQFGNPSKYEGLKEKMSSQFIVSKKNILKNPKSWYIKNYKWLLNTKLDNYWSARYYEWTWKIIFLL